VVFFSKNGIEEEEDPKRNTCPRHPLGQHRRIGWITRHKKHCSCYSRKDKDGTNMSKMNCVYDLFTKKEYVVHGVSPVCFLIGTSGVYDTLTRFICHPPHYLIADTRKDVNVESDLYGLLH
jgi:hypothetical protein